MLAGSFSGSKPPAAGAFCKSGSGRFLLRIGSGLTGSIFIDQGDLRLGTATMPAAARLPCPTGLQSVGRHFLPRHYQAVKHQRPHHVRRRRLAARRLTATNAVNLSGGMADPVCAEHEYHQRRNHQRRVDQERCRQADSKRDQRDSGGTIVKQRHPRRRARRAAGKHYELCDRHLHIMRPTAFFSMC